MLGVITYSKEYSPPFYFFQQQNLWTTYFRTAQLALVTSLSERYSGAIDILIGEQKAKENYRDRLETTLKF